jgi:hypothetical protein
MNFNYFRKLFTKISTPDSPTISPAIASTPVSTLSVEPEIDTLRSEIAELRDCIRLSDVKHVETRRAVEIHHESIGVCAKNIRTIAIICGIVKET